MSAQVKVAMKFDKLKVLVNCILLLLDNTYYYSRPNRNWHMFIFSNSLLIHLDNTLRFVLIQHDIMNTIGTQIQFNNKLFIVSTGICY